MAQTKIGRVEFWTQWEMAQYLRNCVDCGKPINIEIVEEWNKAVENCKEENR